MPGVKRAATAAGDWLASIGWGKFLLLALLLMIFGGIMNDVSRERRAIVLDHRPSSERVNIAVSVGPEGVRITPGTTAAGTPKAPEPPQPPTPPGAPGAPAAPQAAASPPAPSVSIDERGVHVQTEKDGKRVSVLIDANGVRVVEDAGTPAARDGNAIVIPPATAEDPEKLAEALETARDKIEEIVNAQVDRQVARQARVYKEKTSDWIMSFVMLVILAAIIVKIVLGSKKKAEKRAQAATATAAEEGLKRQLAEAQLKMMQAQVEPHFLFNTLASVDYLIETDPARASTMQKNLIQYLRAALPQMREGSTTLGKELALCRSYLEILKVRMEDRLQFAIVVPQGLASAQFPPMMLQSLVENAIKHGLEPKAEGGSLTISADIAHGALRVTVADTGLGFGAAGTAGTGVGLANVRERLAALYGGTAKVSVQSNTPTGTIAVIEVPYSLDTAGRPDVAATVAPQPA
jgi:signal transduction histidine kinase